MPSPRPGALHAALSIILLALATSPALARPTPGTQRRRLLGSDDDDAHHPQQQQQQQQQQNFDTQLRFTADWTNVRPRERTLLSKGQLRARQLAAAGAAASPRSPSPHPWRKPSPSPKPATLLKPAPKPSVPKVSPKPKSPSPRRSPSPSPSPSPLPSPFPEPSPVPSPVPSPSPSPSDTPAALPAASPQFIIPLNNLPEWLKAMLYKPPPPSPSPAPPSPSPPPSPPPPPPPTFDIWILAGSSNMVGDNAGWLSPWPELGHATPGQMLMFPKSTGKWADATPNVGLQSWGLDIHDSLGPETCFGNTLLESGVSHTIGFVPAALGGSILANDWMPTKGWPNLYNNMISLTHRAMSAAGPQARLRGMLFIEGEASAMYQYNNNAPIARTWAANFTTMITSLRNDLSEYNPSLPVVLGVQRIADRDRVYPLIGLIKQQQQELVMPNLMKAQMEDKEFYPVDFSGIFGAQVGMQSIHMTLGGSCDMGIDMARQYMNGVPTLTDQVLPQPSPSPSPPASNQTSPSPPPQDSQQPPAP